MEDYFTLMGIGVGFLILLITLIFLYIVRDTNETKRFLGTQKSETKTFISKIELEGKKLESLAQERIELGKAQSQEELKKMDVAMHQATISCQKSEQDKKLEQTTIIQSSKLRSIELKCKTAKELTGMSLDFERTKLQSIESQFQTNLEFQEKLNNSKLALEYKKVELQGVTAELAAKTTKYITDKNLEGQIYLTQAETERVGLKCQTELKMNHEAACVERERQGVMLRLGEKKIKSQENCFREQMEFNKTREFAKTERCRLKGMASSVNALGTLIGSAAGVAGAATPSGAIAGVLQNCITNSESLVGNRPIIQELPD